MDQLKNKTAQGLYYFGLTNSLSKIISFVNTLIVARLLSPEDYGLMAVVMVIVGFIGFFNEIGLGSAIRQRLEINQAELNGVFSLTMTISTFLYIGLYLLSGYIANFYDDPRLTTLIQVCATTFIIGGFITVPEALLTRELRFKSTALIEFFAIIVHCATTLLLAWQGHGVWALLLGFLLAQLFKALMFSIVAKWLPTKFGNFSEAQSLMAFGLTVTYSRLTWYFYNNANPLIVGKMMNTSAVGVYSMATSLAALPTTIITTLVVRVASPVFSKMQQDLQRLDTALLRLSAGISFIAFPIMTGMTVTADSLVKVLLGEKWMEAIVPLQALCIAGMFKAVEPVITQAFISIGKANLTGRYTTLCALIIPASVFMGATLGEDLTSVAIALGIAYPLTSIYLFSLAKENLAFSLIRYWRALRAPVEASIFMAFIVYSTKEIIIKLVAMPIQILFITEVFIGMLSYLAYLTFVRTEGLAAFKELWLALGRNDSILKKWPFNKV